ncbi:MAG TPA: hypothetical protein VF103_19090 [Polyangiaceae bacterium]
MLRTARLLSRFFAPPFLLSLTLFACEKNPPSGNGGEKGGASGNAGSAPQGGSSGTTGGSAPTGGSGPAGGSGPTGGSTSGGSAGSTGAVAGTSTGGNSGSAGSSPTGGTGGTSAGTGGSATGGAGGGGDPCASAIFCDDFDDAASGGPPATPWTVQRSGSGTAAVDTAHHMSGTQAVKFVVPGQNDGAFIALRNAPYFPVTGNAFYGRVMLWLTAAPTASVHWTLIEGTGLVPGQTYHSAYRLGGQQPVSGGNQLMANYETPDSYGGNGPGSDCWHHANRVVVPVARWSCFEWQYDGPNNALTLWVDQTEVLSVRGMGNTANGDGCVNQPNTFPWTAPTFDTIRVGWDSYQADTERTLWLDDFAISTTRLGCPSGTGQ